MEVLYYCIVLLIGGILMLIPKFGMNPKKLKDGESYEDAVKMGRIIGIIVIIIAIFLIILNVIKISNRYF